MSLQEWKSELVLKLEALAKKLGTDIAGAEAHLHAWLDKELAPEIKEEVKEAEASAGEALEKASGEPEQK